MHEFAGMRLIVSRPFIHVVKRSLLERFFSWPWRPWVKEKSEVIPPTIPTDQCFLIGNQIHCGEQFYENLKKAADASTRNK